MGGTTGGPKDLPSSPASGFVPIHDRSGFSGDLPQPAALTSKNAITPPLPLGLIDGIGPGQDRVKAASEFRHVAAGPGLFPRNAQGDAAIQGIKLEGAKADLLEQALKARDLIDLERFDTALQRRDTLLSDPEKDFLRGVAENRFDDITDDRFETLAAEGLGTLGTSPAHDVAGDMDDDIDATPAEPTLETNSENSTKPPGIVFKDKLKMPEKPLEIYADRKKAAEVILGLMRGDIRLPAVPPDNSRSARILTIDRYQLNLRTTALYREATGMKADKLKVFQRRVAQDQVLDDVQKATLLIRARESAAGRSLDTLEHGKLFDQVHQDLLRLDAFRTQRRKFNQLLGGAPVMQGRGKGLRSKTSFKSGISGAASDAAGGAGQAGANHKTPEDDEK